MGFFFFTRSCGFEQVNWTCYHISLLLGGLCDSLTMSFTKEQKKVDLVHLKLSKNVELRDEAKQ